MSESPEPRPESDRLIVGKLIAHGPGTHEGVPSYFTEVHTARGRLVIWDKELQRAFGRSETQPQLGEPIGMKQNGTHPVVVEHYRSQGAGSPVLDHRLEHARPHWVVERKEWFDERLAAAKVLRDPRVPAYKAVNDHPQLEGAYSVLIRVIQLSYKHYRRHENRIHAVGLVREALARTAEIGEPLPPKLIPDPVLSEGLDQSRKRDALTR